MDDEHSCDTCDTLCTSILNPANSADNFKNLLNELCGVISVGNTPEGKSFADIKDEFISENYPGLEEGFHAFPDIFISKEATHTFNEETNDQQQRMMYEFIEHHFKGTDCFVFQNFDGGIGVLSFSLL